MSPYNFLAQKHYPEIVKNNFEFFSLRGMVQAHLTKFKEAVKDFDRALEIDDKNIYMYAARSLAKTQIGDVDGAFADANKSIALDRYFSGAYVARAGAYFKMKKQEEVCGDLFYAADLGSPNAAVQVNSWCKN